MRLRTSAEWRTYSEEFIEDVDFLVMTRESPDMIVIRMGCGTKKALISRLYRWDRPDLARYVSRG